MSKTDQKKRQRRTSDSDSDDNQLSSKQIHADGYDDKYRGNADDRAWLKTLTERQREEELLKRHERRETLKHREEITKKLKSKLKSDDDDDDDDNIDHEIKDKSTLFDNDIYAEDDDDDYRSSTTNRRQQVNASKQKETEHSKLLQVLVEERKKKEGEKFKKSIPKSNNLSSAVDKVQENSRKSNDKGPWKVKDIYQSETSEDTDDDDDDNTRHRRSRSPDNRGKDTEKQESGRKKCTPITAKSQLKSMVLSRFRMEKWCHAPFFANVAKGAFVRINIGQNNGMPVYRICEIRDVVETSKIYNLGPTRTNKGLRLKHGHNERVFRLEYVSNSEISDAEFKRWRETTIKQAVPLPTLQDLENKIKAIEKCKHYVYSNTDISKIVEEKSRFRKTPINYAMTKNELFKEIEIAKDENDTENENRLRKKLNEMEERASELDRKRSENISIITQINRRNRKSTQQNVENALTREAQEHKNAASDPFTRRRCAPMLVSRAPPTKDELIRELQLQRATEEAAVAARKKLEEQRLLAEQKKAKIFTTTTTTITDKRTLPEPDLPSMTTHERGSFTSFSENNDELFTSHNFELDFAIKLFSDQF